MPFKIITKGGENMIIYVQPNQTKDWTFDYYLAKRFRKIELEEAYDVYTGPMKVRDFKGIARSVATHLRKEYGSADRKQITESLKKALEIYDSVPDNGDEFFGRYEVSDYWRRFDAIMKNFKR